MPVPLPTVQNIEDFLQQVEEYVVDTVHSAAPNMPSVRQAFEKLWEDINRFGPWQSLPPLPDIRMPSLGAFEVPPPPPPPPQPHSLLERSADWACAHPWKTAFIGVGFVGAGVAVGYGGLYLRGAAKARKVRAATSSKSDGERRQVIVVLGGDSPLGLPLILDLERQGYIVITSVSGPDAVDEIERHTHGYVRAIVLDPCEPNTVPYFLRSLASTMSRRFPMTASGDPHSSPSTQTYIQAIISLLTLPQADIVPPPGPLESLSLSDSYFTYLQATHFTPLHVIQALLPLLRNSPARTRDEINRHKAKRSVIMCLPAKDARVGLPFAGAQAMSAAATLRGVEVLRREVRAAATTDVTMRNIKVVVVDVGSIGPQAIMESQDMSLDRAMLDWTASEKASYGPAFTSVFGSEKRPGAGRKPSDVSSFVSTVTNIVSNGKKHAGSASSLELVFGRLREWLQGNRVAVGAGARTYVLASALPSLILDGLLNLPQVLMSFRNSMIPAPPPPALPYPPPEPPVAAPAPAPASAPPLTERRPLSERTSVPIDSDSDPHPDSETGSEADVESNEGGYGSGVSESWISLQKESQDHV